MDQTAAAILAGAVAAGDGHEVERLLAAGTPADAREGDDATPLMRARDAAMASRLIAAGADVNASARYGRTPLLEALANRQLDVVAVLVGAGCDLERRDGDRTPLLRFCGMYELSAAAVDALVRAGADVHATTTRGSTALHIASQLYAGDRLGRLGLAVRVLVAAGLPVDVRDRDDETPLFASLGSEGGDVAVVRTLLDLGADVNARCSRGATPLMTAVTCYRAHEVVRVLLAGGADATAHNRGGATALTWALEHHQIWLRIVADRRDAGLSARARDEQRRSDRQKLAETREVVGLLRAAMPGAVSVPVAIAASPAPPPTSLPDPLTIAAEGLARVPQLTYAEAEALTHALGLVADATPLRPALRALWAPRDDRDESWYRGLASVFRAVAADPGIVELLVNDLFATDPAAKQRRATAIDVLGCSRSEVAARALVRLVHADRDAMYAVTAAFADLRRPEAWATIVLDLAAHPAHWRYGGLEALVASGGERALPILLQMLDTEECARAAVPFLASFDGAAVDDRLAMLCGHPDAEVRLQAALVLVRHRGEAAVESLVSVARTLLDAGRPIGLDVWDQAADALGEHPGDGLEAWAAWLARRGRAAARIPMIPPPLARLTSRSDRARDEALAALHLGRDPAHLTALMLGEQLHRAWGVGNREPTDWDTWTSIIPMEVLLDRDHRLGSWLDAERERLPVQIVPELLAVIPIGGLDAARAQLDRLDPGFQLALTDDQLARLRAEEAAIAAR